jgi:GntR family transcriptional regulator/MocR family aminotransferase
VKNPAGILPAITVDRASPKPLHRQLYEEYRDAIVERRLRAGQRIPPTRALAEALGISRIPVLNAFEQLAAEGYFESRGGSGTFVAEAFDEGLATPKARATRSPARCAPRPIARQAASAPAESSPWYRGRGAFAVGQPPVDRFPERIWSRLVARRCRAADESLLHYASHLGFEPLRTAVAEYLRTARGVRCEAAQIMIVGGSQQGLDLAARVLLDPGSPAWIEDPGYFGVRRVVHQAGACAVPVPVDEEGLVVAEGIARSPRARAAFVTPSHQFPLGVTMSAARRLQLLDWAQAAGAWIVEDDYDSEYRYGNLPVASLQGLDRDARVIYVGTFTKILFPAIRLGYVVIPPDLLPAFGAVRGASDFFSPTFLQAVLTDFIEEGHFARHVRRMRVLCGERRAALVEALRTELGPELRVLGDPAGMFLTVELTGRGRDREIAERAAERGLWTAPLSECYRDGSGRQGLVLGFGGVGSPQIRRGVLALRELVASGTPSGRPVRRAASRSTTARSNGATVPNRPIPLAGR